MYAWTIDTHAHIRDRRTAMNVTRIIRTPAMATALLTGFATLACASIAQAGDAAAAGTSVTRVVVNYGDLNLATKAGARTLYARLQLAAEQACGSEPESRDLRAWLDYQTCYSTALDNAVRKVDNSNLQALHRKRSASAVG
jgi:UrcA family protein